MCIKTKIMSNKTKITRINNFIITNINNSHRINTKIAKINNITFKIYKKIKIKTKIILTFTNKKS